MTHAPFIIAAYAIALLTPLALTIFAYTRRAAARRVLQGMANEKTTP
jgi:heme exporter protein D